MTLYEAGADMQVVAAQLAKSAPRWWKLVFLNYEFQDDASGAVSSAVSFVVVKPWFHSAQKLDFDLKADDLIVLTRACRALCEKADQPFLTLDLVVQKDNFKSYIDYEPPVRLGGDIAAANRQERYLNEFPLLGTKP